MIGFPDFCRVFSVTSGDRRSWKIDDKMVILMRVWHIFQDVSCKTWRGWRSGGWGNRWLWSGFGRQKTDPGSCGLTMEQGEGVRFIPHNRVLSPRLSEWVKRFLMWGFQTSTDIDEKVVISTSMYSITHPPRYNPNTTYYPICSSTLSAWNLITKSTNCLHL